jgi:hypothetical protein
VSSLGVFDAAQQTAGVFLSVCDDWSTDFALLAEHMVRPLFPLGELPLDPLHPDITVTVDGQTIDSGWMYDAQSNAIRFDDGSYPPAGSVVGIEYGRALDCD